MTYSVRNIAIAIVMAIAAAAAVLVYTSSYKQSLTRGQKRIDVMVASRDIPAGTKAEDAAGAMTKTSVLVDDRTPGALTTTAGLEGKVASQTVYAGQQVVAAVFQSSISGNNKSILLSKTERALRVVCSPDPSCLLGDIQPGDKVDVFETVKVKPANGSGDPKLITRLLLPGVKILAVPEQDPKKGGLSSGADRTKPTVMIVVDQQLAAKFAWLNGEGDEIGGQIWFAVRPPDASAQDQPYVIETVESMLTDGMPVDEVKKLLASVGQTPQGGN